MTKNYDSFVAYMEAVKVELLKRVEMTVEEAADLSETFGDYYEEGVDPAAAVLETLHYASEDGDYVNVGDGETLQ